MANGFSREKKCLPKIKIAWIFRQAMYYWTIFYYAYDIALYIKNNTMEQKKN